MYLINSPSLPRYQGFPPGSAGKECACNVRDLDSIPGLGRSPGEGNGSPLQYFSLENSMGCVVHGVTKSQTRLSNFHQDNKATLESCYWLRKFGAKQEMKSLSNRSKIKQPIHCSRVFCYCYCSSSRQWNVRLGNIKTANGRTSLVVQWLGLAYIAGGTGSIPVGQLRSRMPHGTAKKKKKKSNYEETRKPGKRWRLRQAAPNLLTDCICKVRKFSNINNITKKSLFARQALGEKNPKLQNYVLCKRAWASNLIANLNQKPFASVHKEETIISPEMLFFLTLLQHPVNHYLPLYDSAHVSFPWKHLLNSLRLAVMSYTWVLL